MFIELPGLDQYLRSSGAKCMVRSTHLPAHCAPLERQHQSASRSINIWLLWSLERPLVANQLSHDQILGFQI